MILNEAYEHLKQHGLVDSHVEFSTRWLNKSPRYMSMIRASGRQPSIDTLARLLANLKFHHDTYRQSRLSFVQERADKIAPMLRALNSALLREATQFTHADVMA